MHMPHALPGEAWDLPRIYLASPGLLRDQNHQYLRRRRQHYLATEVFKLVAVSTPEVIT